MKLKHQKKAQITEVETLNRVLDLEIVDDRRLAIDAGAHIGTWSAVMCLHFQKVIAFEPNPDTFKVLVENVGGLGDIDMHCKAVMDRAGPTTCFAPRPGAAAAGWQVRHDPEGTTKAIAIDDLDLDYCGLIKLDLEGAELLALRGATRTISSFRPVLIVEFAGHSERFGHTDKMIHGHILGSGYREFFRGGVDRVFVPQ